MLKECRCVRHFLKLYENLTCQRKKSTLSGLFSISRHKMISSLLFQCQKLNHFSKWSCSVQNYISVFNGTPEKISIQHHQYYSTNSLTLIDGSVGVLVASRVRRESWIRNYSSLVLLCVSACCRRENAKDF